MKEKIKSLINPSFEYHYKNEKFVFLDFEEDIVSDSIDKIKTFFKNFQAFYDFLIYIISPQYPSRYFFLKKLLSRTKDKNLVIVNLGSGYTHLREDIINVDLIPYKPVDVVCDITQLPFKDNSVDQIINIAVLEHVPNPQAVISEIHRVLKPGGKLLCEIPFMQGFHASPYDFQRFTYEGIKVQFKEFGNLRIHTNSPTGGMLWLLQEWIAMLLSFGIKPLHNLILIILMCLTFPIKFLDIILQKHPLSKNIASAFIFECEKNN